MPQRPPSDTLFVAGPEQLASLLDATEGLLLVVSPEAAILYCSSGLCTLLDTSSEQLLGQSLFRFFLEEDYPSLNRLFRESSYTPRARGRCRLRTKNGDYQ